MTEPIVHDDDYNLYVRELTIAEAELFLVNGLTATAAGLRVTQLSKNEEAFLIGHYAIVIGERNKPSS